MRFATLALVLATAAPAAAQTTSITGNVSALIDHLPNVPVAGQPSLSVANTELRLRALADLQLEARPWLRFRFAGAGEAGVVERSGSRYPGYADALEAWVEVAASRADLRAGMSRVTWGRLDEVQPTDVVNPIDVARYLLDGRSEARLAVPLVRARLFPTDKFTIEGVLVPVFRRGTFDRLDEETSPFNLLRDIPQPACPPGVPCPPAWRTVHEDPARELQGGARVSVTMGRVDWSVSVFDGIVPFGLIEASAGEPGTLNLRHPRFVMYGADVETVVGRWALRGEGAWFPKKPVQDAETSLVFETDSIEAGAGVDRRAGDFTLFGTVLYRRADRPVQRGSQALPNGAVLAVYGYEPHNNVSGVLGFSRTFNRDRVEAKLFSLVNPDDKAGFVRGVVAWKARDDLALESSIGWFIGDGNDVITRFGDRDFASVRVKYYFGR